MCVYIYIYTHLSLSISLSLYLSIYLYLSLSLYIYIYIHMYISATRPAGEERRLGRPHAGARSFFNRRLNYLNTYYHYY